MEAIQPCIIANGEFNVVQNQGTSCTICGRYLVQTSPEADYFLQAEQRCTFVWELISDTPKIRHMHVSNPMGELKIADGSRFVNEIGQMAKKYLEEKIQDLTGSQIVVPAVTAVRFFCFCGIFSMRKPACATAKFSLKTVSRLP